MRRTKIVATIGPASREPETLLDGRAGMDVARLNYSHGTLEEHAETVRRVRDAAGTRRAPGRDPAGPAGPKLRIGPLAAALPSNGARELVTRLETAIELLDATLDECRQRFGMERVGRHFLLGPLRVDQWRRYHVLHLGHHRTQMCDLRKTLSVEVLRKAEMANA